MQTADIVVPGVRDAYRWIALRTRREHQPRTSLQCHIHAGPALARAALAEGCHARVDETRIGLGQRAITDAKPLQHTAGEILDEHIGFVDEPARNGDTTLGLEVEIDRAAVAIDVIEMRRTAIGAGGALAAPRTG